MHLLDNKVFVTIGARCNHGNPLKICSSFNVTDLISHPIGYKEGAEL